MVVATIEGSNLQYVHTDHLTGSNAVTNSAAGTVQLMDYFPYGSMRIDWQGETFDEQRKFTGHEMDRATNLTYANARYYKHTIGRFLSQDKIASQAPEKLLLDPQQLNMYAYARNNPLIYTDPTGNFAFLLIPILANPAALTVIAGAAAGLIAALPHSAASVGYFMEGDVQSANQSAQTAIMAEGVGGAIAGLAAGGGQTKQMSASSANQSKLNTSQTSSVPAGQQTKMQNRQSQSMYHGNDLRTQRPTYGYTLRDKNTGAILKYGETTNPD